MSSRNELHFLDDGSNKHRHRRLVCQLEGEKPISKLIYYNFYILKNPFVLWDEKYHDQYQQ